ncbi:hypothetical protein CYMTET_14168 [Cymbomonas tetramitiformis]|uniref:Uncharacterized protein n=1 Tax=Cymbomonas tetramitiformis TaxID=36881 RepID=A0AAE0LAM9_9CHLO|nr:hypothetical protein CYMTET_14168 [Cymbomonas tetramitiformis]
MKQRMRDALGIVIGHDIEDHTSVPYLHTTTLLEVAEVSQQEAPTIRDGDAEEAPTVAQMVVINQALRVRETKEEGETRRAAKRAAVVVVKLM